MKFKYLFGIQNARQLRRDLNT